MIIVVDGPAKEAAAFYLFGLFNIDDSITK